MRSSCGVGVVFRRFSKGSGARPHQSAIEIISRNNHLGGLARECVAVCPSPRWRGREGRTKSSLLRTGKKRREPSRNSLRSSRSDKDNPRKVVVIRVVQ